MRAMRDRGEPEQKIEHGHAVRYDPFQLTLIVLLLSLMIGVGVVRQDPVRAEAPIGTTAAVRAAGHNNTPPQFFQPVPPQVYEEDAAPWAVALTAHVIDAEDDHAALRWRVVGYDEELVEVYGQNTSMLVFRPVPNATGTTQTTFIAYDSVGADARQNVSITLTPVDDPPDVQPLPALTLPTNRRHELDLGPYITDIDTDIGTYSLRASDSDHISINGTRLVFSYPTAMDGSEQLISAELHDTAGATLARLTIDITIVDAPAPTLDAPIAPITIEEDRESRAVIDLGAHFRAGPGGQGPLRYNASPTPVNITINATGSVTISTRGNWTGSRQIAFYAINEVGVATQEVTQLTVLPQNDPPRVAPIPTLELKRDTAYRLDVEPYVTDADNARSALALTALADPRVTPGDRPLEALITPPALAMEETIDLAVTDADAVTVFTIRYNATENAPPVLEEEFYDQIRYESENLAPLLDLGDYFVDPDDTELNFSVDAAPILNSTVAGSVLELRPPPYWNGIESIMVKVTDPAGAWSCTCFDLVVLPVNDPPVIDDIENQFRAPGKHWLLDIRFYVSDPDDAYEDLEFSVDSVYVEPTQSNRYLLFFYPDDILDGREEVLNAVTLTVSDGEASTSRTFLVYIREPESDPEAGFFDPDWVVPLIVVSIMAAMLIGIEIVIYRLITGRYRIEEVFVIYRNGTLLTHISAKSWGDMDEEILSGMFTAVQDFVRDSFSYRSGEGEDANLDKLELGENKIQIERGEHLIVAVIFTGGGARKLKARLTEVVTELETTYQDQLVGWNGRLSEFTGLRETVEELLPLEEAEYETEKAKHE